MEDAAETVPAGGATALRRGKLKSSDFSLRLCVVSLSAASLWLTVGNRQVNDGYGGLAYADLTGMKYLVWVDALSAGYAVFSLLSSSLRWFTNVWIFFISDQVISYLLVTSGSAVAEILYLAYKGDRDVSWSRGCDSFGHVCVRAKVSLVLHFLAAGCFVALALISAFGAFSRFEAPSSSSKERTQQMDSA